MLVRPLGTFCVAFETTCSETYLRLAVLQQCMSERQEILIPGATCYLHLEACHVVMFAKFVKYLQKIERAKPQRGRIRKVLTR